MRQIAFSFSPSRTSRSAITQAVVLLEGRGLVERSRARGERVDRISIRLDRLISEQDYDPASYLDMAALLRRGVALVDDDSGRRETLEELAALYDFLAERMPQLQKEWLAHRAALRGEQLALLGNRAWRDEVLASLRGPGWRGWTAVDTDAGTDAPQTSELRALRDSLEAVVRAAPGEVGIALVDLDTGAGIGIGDVNNNGWVDLIVMRKQPFTSPGKRVNVLFMNEGGVLVDRTAEYASERSMRPM
jgi:hypothetical protein